MSLGEWIVEVGASLLTIRNVYSARARMRAGIGVTWPSLTWVLLWVIAIIYIPMSGRTPYHLMWVLPVSVVFGVLTMPLSTLLGPLQPLLALPGTLFGYLCAIGIDREEIARNAARETRFRELLLQGVSPEEARRRVEAGS